MDSILQTPDLFQQTLGGEEPLTEPFCSAALSEDRRYRYELWRRWSGGDYCCFVGLNPSTADESADDPTIRRCINFAKAWGYGSLCMVNLFAYRATDPSVMKKEPEPVGADNDETLQRLTQGAGIVIAAWGVHGVHMDRANEVMINLPKLHCLGLTKDGHPRHPLYLPKTSEPMPLNVIADPRPKPENQTEK